MRFGLTLALFAVLFTVVNGHGRLIKPPSRSSMWRFGFDTPKNPDDAGLFCGGFQTQQKNGGKCGICGDNWSDPKPRANEAGGKYGNGIIVDTFEIGQTIDTVVTLTANHKGYFEFRLCQNDKINAELEQDCFDKHLLEGENGETKFVITPAMKEPLHKVRLPAGVGCKACVLQWRYTAGNSWGIDPQTGKGCSGCGPQENFQACADISIGNEGVETGATDNIPEVPEGEEDERENLKNAVEYDAGGNCNCMSIATPAMCHNLPTLLWSNRH